LPHINIEIKARTTELEKIREILKTNNADFIGVDHQVDTYFKVDSGRLKLREGNIENHLIYYERENTKGPKKSSVLLYKNNPDSNLKEMLLKSLGVLAVVDNTERFILLILLSFIWITLWDWEHLSR